MGADAAMLVERALLADAARAGCAVAVSGTRSRHWASATFSGARHRLELSAVRSAALDAWITRLPEAEFPVRGHLIADLSVCSVRREGDAVTASLDLLTVEER